MNKFNEIKNLYKTNRKLFDTIVLIVNIVLIIWQAIFALIIPSRANIFILLALIAAAIYQFIKNS